MWSIKVWGSHLWLESLEQNHIEAYSQHCPCAVRCQGIHEHVRVPCMWRLKMFKGLPPSRRPYRTNYLQLIFYDDSRTSFECKDEMVIRPSFLYNRNSYRGKTSCYLNGPRIICYWLFVMGYQWQSICVNGWNTFTYTYHYNTKANDSANSDIDCITWNHISNL